MRKYSILLIGLLGLVMAARSQQTGNTRIKNLLLLQDSIQLDTMVVFKGTVSIADETVQYKEGLDYAVNYKTSTLIVGQNLRNKQVRVTYQVMLFDIKQAYSNKPKDLLNPEYTVVKNPFLYESAPNSGPLFNKDGLKMNGNLSRGLSFGNNQDVVINSNLNLQLSGRIQNDIDVVAAISDENNPIQPEGNTQQLQDFDKVFIKLSKNRSTLTVGDFEMSRPDQSYFMNYFKKSRGGQFYSAADLGKSKELKFGGEGAISRGRFARNVIQGIEGNQGPYRLSGANNELFIILISGTEAVYLDGQKLVRGEQNDYVIDYNSGEITFMPKRVITQYSRIVVEFQYSDRNFARSVFHLNTEYHTEKFRLRANYFTEQDDPDQPFLQNLTDSNKKILADAGDNLSMALAPSATPTTIFSNSKILYRKIDTLGFTGVYLFTNDPNSDSVFYEVRFSFVGEGKGDYVQAQSSANGRVFQWVQPIAGISQGSYAPVIQLVSPKRLQMFTIGTDLMLIKNTTVSVELARSEYDKNRYADFDKADDGGYGIKTGVVNTTKLQDKPVDFWNLKTEAGHEYVDKQFRYVERYRNVEFDRTWNRLLSNQATLDTGYEEHILSFKTSLNKSSVGSVYYQAGYYSRASAFSGYQGLAGTALHVAKNHLLAEAEWINTQNKTGAVAVSNETRRYKIDYGRELWLWLAGARYEQEQSSFFRGSDTLFGGSYAFHQYAFYVNNLDTGNLRYKIEYSQREDYLPVSKEFSKTTTGKNLNGNIDYTQKNFNRLSAQFTYREFIIHDTALIKQPPENTILARIEYDYGFIKRVFTANTYYQVGSGNELRRDFQFLEVPVGQGIYVWRDFNDDGNKDLNEFITASGIERNQANYIKVFLPTNSSIRVNSNLFSQTLNINPAAVWSSRQGLKRFIARWYNQTALKLDRKTTKLSTEDFLNPFLFQIADSELVSNASVVRNTLFFNRTGSTFGFDLNYSDNRNKTFQTNGFDSRHREEKGANMRWNVSSSWSVNCAYNFGDRKYTSDFFSSNNYSYAYQEIKPKLIYQLTSNIRTTLVFSYFEGINKAELGNEKGTNREFGGEIRFNAARQGVLNGRYSFYQVSYNGNISSPLGYDMLQGFTVGENQVWNINYQQRVGTNLQIQINYDGRKSEGQDVIHIGRMEARYLF